MISGLELVEMFEDFDYCLEYGVLGVVKTEDGFWFCNRDVDSLKRDIEWKKAPVQMQDAYRESLLEEEDLFLKQEDERVEDIVFEREQPSETSIALQNHDYFGTRDKVINEQMQGAFEPAFGSDFSL